MKRQFQYLSILLIISLFNISARAQAPSISYTPSTYLLKSGVPISTTFPGNITLTSTSGTVPANLYGNVTTLVNTVSNINTPQGLTTDGAGNIYEADQGGDVIYKITSTGTATIFSGNGTAGERNSSAGAPEFNNPSGIVYDGAGNLYVTDVGNGFNSGNTVRKIVIATGIVTTIAGSNGSGSTVDSPIGANARFDGPTGITYDGTGFLYVCDNGGNRIRKISTTSPFAVTTLAGNGTGTDKNGTGATGAGAAQFDSPAGIVYDGTGNLYVCDNGAHTIRKIVIATSVVTTFAGTSGSRATTDGTGANARFKNPWGITIDASGNLYVADEGNFLIRKITTPGAVVTTLAGDNNQADLDAIGINAEFYSPYAIVADNVGNLFVGDNHGSSSTIRKMPLTGYIITPDLPSGLTLGTNGTISGTHTGSFVATDYTVTAYNLSGSNSTTVTLACGQNKTWDGSFSTQWGIANNWTPSGVPLSSDDVQIGVDNTINFPNAPLINGTTGDVEVNSLTFGNKKTFTLTVTTSDLKVDKSITVNTGAVTTVLGTGSLTMAPGSTLNFLTTGKLAISTTGFTLQSDATGSAAIGPVLTPTNFTGTSLASITVERYMQGGSLSERGYRLMSSPVYASTAPGYPVYSINYIINGAFLTGTDGITVGGFDQVGSPTLYLYRENMIGTTTNFTTGNFRGIKNIKQSPAYKYLVDGDGATPFTIPVGNGFLFFFRGNRSTINPFNILTVPNSSTLSTSGTLNVGQVTVKDWFTPGSNFLSYTASSSGVAGFNCVGNPYACAIDWDLFQNTTTTSQIYGTGLVGGSVTTPDIWVYNPISKTFGSYRKGLPSSDAFVSHIIASGQGFFVRANSTTAQLIFNEDAKSVQSQNTGVQLLMSKKPVALAKLQFLRLQFGLDSASSEQTVINFNSQAPLTYTDKLNVTHLQGTGSGSLSTLSSDLVDLSIHSVPFPGQQQGQSVQLKINAAASGIYTLKMRDLVAVPQLYDIWLMDAYKKDSVNLRKTNSYSVDINKADSASFGSNRLSLVVRQNAALAYKLIDFTANKSQNGRHVEVLWKTENEENYTNFTVERSIDNGKTFDVLGGVKANGGGSYSFTDKDPDNRRNFYRLKQEDLNNNITYSKIAEVRYRDTPYAWDKLRIFPNPASHIINLSVDERYDQKGCYYSIRFMNSSGTIVKQITSSQPEWQGNISNLRPGSYLVRVINNRTQSLVGENKFVKL